MILIAAVDKRWSIGNKGSLLVSIPEDQKLFRQETLGKVVVMGRKTLESLPGGKPLYGRTTLVLSRNENYQVKGAQVFRDMESLLEELKKYPSESIYICGGEQIYREFLPYCDIADITYIDYTYQADTRFPNLDEDPEWELLLESDEKTYFDLCYTFRRYQKTKR